MVHSCKGRLHMNIALWIVQVLLGGMFLMAGVMKAFQYERAKASLSWVKTVPRSLTTFSGISELLGGLGLLLRIYAESRTIAVVGASADETKAAHRIPRYLQAQGERIVRVNPRGGELFGEHVFHSLAEVDVPID